MNGYFHTITAGFMGMSISLAAMGAAAFTGPIRSAAHPLCSMAASLPPENTEAAKPEWETLSPAAKVADVCESVEVAALAGEDLSDYLRTTSVSCLKRTLHVSNNPSIKNDLPTIFSDRNMQSVFAEIKKSAPDYDGTNNTGMVHLWFFVQVGYDYQRFYSGITGVGPFDEATDRAYLAASDAFASSEHFYAPNDDAASILVNYFEVAFLAGLRGNHLAPIKRVLSGFTPERADSRLQREAFEKVLRRVNGAFQNRDEGITADQVFFEALAADTEFVDVLLQVTRYDFYFLGEDHPFTPRLGLLERVVKILTRLTGLDPFEEQALSALTSVLSWHERLSSPFLMAAKALENQELDCTSLNICRDVLESEIYTRSLPNTYSLDGGALVFETSLRLEEVQPLYQGAKEMKARFHRLVETDEPAVEGLETFTTRLYATRYDYTVFEAYLGGVNTREFSGGYYSAGTMATAVTPAEQRVGDNPDHVDTFLHEYGHYLADRSGLLKFGSLWFNEGLAEFLVSRIGAAVRYAAGSETRPDPAELFQSEYTFFFEDHYSYNFSQLFFHFMHQRRRTALLELLDLVRSGDYGAFQGLIETWAEDTQLAADYASFLDEQVAKVGSLPDPSFRYILPGALTSDSAEEIQSLLQQVDEDLGLICQSVETESERGFVCTGSLPAESRFSGDRGALNEHLNSRLDGFVARAMGNGKINNFEVMTCYFTNVAGIPPVADLRCHGPLRPQGQVLGTQDLRASLFSDGGDFNLYVGERHSVSAYLDFSAESASNVIVTWSSNLPIVAVNQISSVPCEVVEETELRGKFACGQVYKEEGRTPLGILLYFNPLEAGSLVFSVEFSSDEPEVEPADNVASLQLTITQPSQHIATLLHTGFVESVAFSPDSTIFASGSRDGTVKFWDVGTLSHIATLESDSGVRSVVFSPHGRTLASGMENGTVRLWDVERETLTATLEGDLIVHSVAFSPDGKILAAGLKGGTVRLWDLETETSASFSWYVGHVLSVAFSPDGSRLAAGLSNSSSGPDHATIQLLDVKTDSEIVTLSGHTLYIQSVAFSPDGTTLASGSADGTVRLWDVETGTNTATFDFNSIVHSVTFSRDGSILAAALEDASIRIYDLETGRELGSLVGHVFPASSLAFSLDGTLLASVGGRYKPVQVWDVSKWTIPSPVTLAKTSGDAQQELSGALLPKPFVVEVRDRRGNPLEGARVTFTVTDGDGMLSVETATTDSSGRAKTTLTLGRKPGTNTVTVTVGDLAPEIFTATGVAIPRTLTIVSGNDQKGQVGTPLGKALIVSVQDQNGEPLAGAAVTFAVTAGEGKLSAEAATTDSSGRASSTLTLGRGSGTHSVEVTVGDLDPVIFTASTEATADFDGDGETGFSDFFLFADAFGGSDPRFDLDGSGTVDFGDFFLLADHFGDPARGKLLALAWEMIGLPDGPQLQNAPNPFNSETNISWFLLRPGPARVEVFALTGQRVTVLHQGPKKAGVHRVHWDGRDDQGRPLASGVYLYRLVTDVSVQTRKLTLLR